MKKRTLAPLAFMLLCVSILFGNNSDEFLIGANVYNKASNDASAHRFLSERLYDGGFNAGVCTTLDNSDPAGVCSMLSIMNSHQIDGILEDYNFDTVNQRYGARTLSGGNYYRFEAEYADSNSIIDAEIRKRNSFFYMSPKEHNARVGMRNSLQDVFYSNRHYWQVDNGVEGYAYHDLMYKWPAVDGDTCRVGEEFRFPFNGTGNTDFFNDNDFYITFAMNVENISGLPDDTILADIRFTCKGLSTSVQDSTVIPHKKINGSNGFMTSHITKEMYENSPYDPYNPSIHFLKYSIPYGWLYSLGAIIDYDGYWDKLLVNLNPTLYWWGHGTLKLDYIEYQDKLFKDYTNNDAILQNMANSRTFGQSYLYGMNEPSKGQLASFKRISRYLESYSGTPTIITKKVIGYKGM